MVEQYVVDWLKATVLAASKMTLDWVTISELVGLGAWLAPSSLASSVRKDAKIGHRKSNRSLNRLKCHKNARMGVLEKPAKWGN